MDKKQHLALEAIRKKLLGKKLSYREIYAIMDEIAHDKLGDVLTTYFVASGYSHGFSDEEIYYLTRSMVETGEKLSLKGIIADKHSIGGLPGTRTTLIVVPILAAAGFKIPKSSSRAITTPAGTADVMEVFANVSFDKKGIYKLLDEASGCIVWGGSFNIAPADDEIIRIEEPLLFESYDKILVSVMAKKIAFSSTHVVIDIPYGKTMKVRKREDAEILGKKFVNLASRFNIKLSAIIERSEEPMGNGIGPLLEGKDALLVLEQDNLRPIALEKKALRLSSELLTLCLEDSPDIFRKAIKTHYKTPYDWASDILVSGKALSKFHEIIKSQGGNYHVKSPDLLPGKCRSEIAAQKKGVIASINSKNITIIARILGCPDSKKSGIFLCKKLDDKVAKGETICEFFSTSSYKVKEAVDSLDIFPIYEID